MLTSREFSYNKQKVIQALRYHFISRQEIKVMLILVNVFAIISASLFFFKKITPTAFFVSSALWVLLMIMFWFVMPYMVYSKARTFKDRFIATLESSGFGIHNENNSRTWAWEEFSNFIESPHFFHLYFNQQSFFLVPKDAFNESQINEARQMFKSKIIKKA